MNFRQIEAFRHVMLHGSVTRAADAMSLSQPAVSHLVSDLEDWLGFTLFVRRNGGTDARGEGDPHAPQWPPAGSSAGIHRQ
jgi:DNA-binding transcriptional LysR family regulator